MSDALGTPLLEALLDFVGSEQHHPAQPAALRPGRRDPILMLQHMVWHEGYHHGQIKLALKVAGRPLTDTRVGRGTWGIWMRKQNG